MPKTLKQLQQEKKQALKTPNAPGISRHLARLDTLIKRRQQGIGTPGGQNGNGGGGAGGYGKQKLGVNKDTGQINPQVASNTVTGASFEDMMRTFMMNNPGFQQGADGSTQETEIDPVTGEVRIKQKGGANFDAATQAFLDSIGDFTANGKGAAMDAQNANFDYITRNYGQQKQQEMAAAKQELAERGIPLDPNPNSLYGKTLGEIDKKYQTLNDQANQQAITTGNQTLATRAGVVGSLGQTLQGQSPTFTAFQGGASNLTPNILQLMGITSQADLAKYIADQQAGLTREQIAAQKAAAGSGGGSQSIDGGAAPGFGV